MLFQLGDLRADLASLVGYDLAVTLGPGDLLAGSMDLNLQAVDAAIDLDDERLQVDGLTFANDQSLACVGSHFGGRLDPGGKPRTILA